MDIKDVKRTTVIGAAGSMGSQIAEIFSRVGEYRVNIVDINDQFVKKAFKTIEDRMERFFVAKGKMTAAEKKTIISRISGYTSIEEAVKDADFVIEAVIENLALKKDIFKCLNDCAPQRTILATNTSYQNISDIASVTGRPDKIVGVHFFNPVHAMRLVEVIRSARTSDETVSIACDLTRKLGKEPVVCRDSSYGFLANRAYMPLANEAVQMVWERVATPEDIDKALKLGYNLPMGPLELMDFINGWSLWYSSEQDSIRELGPEKGRLHPLLKTMMRSGYTKIYEFWNDVLSKW